MNELSLFSGAGGGLLASHLLGWNTIGYVEWDDYCQRVIAQRITDGFLPTAPIFGDIRSFVSDGYAERYRGVVDVVSGGFPCQPFSVAGKRAGELDDRNMWPATAEVLRAVRPRYAFLENVPGLLAHADYYGSILGQLAEIGYNVKWMVLGADDVGAPHVRKRLWIRCELANPNSRRKLQQEGRKPNERGRACNSCGGGRGATWWGQDPAEGPQPGLGGMVDGLADRLVVPRTVSGCANRSKRLRALGNGQIPSVAALAWRLLSQ